MRVSTCQLCQHATKVQTGQRTWNGAQFGFMNPQLSALLAFWCSLLTA